MSLRETPFPASPVVSVGKIPTKAAKEKANFALEAPSYLCGVKPPEKSHGQKCVELVLQFPRGSGLGWGFFISLASFSI